MESSCALDTLLPALLADLKPRTRSEIERAGYAGYLEAVKGATVLTDLCEEKGNSETEIRGGICRWVEEAITSRHLIRTRRHNKLSFSRRERSLAGLFSSCP